MLLSGCWAVAETPAVWVCVRRRIDSGFLAPKRSFMKRAQSRRAARGLAISWKKSLWMAKKNDRRCADVLVLCPGREDDSGAARVAARGEARASPAGPP